MKILDFDPEEFEEALDTIAENGNFIQDIECSLESLLFLGKNILNSEDTGLLDCAIFNIRLCYTYYSKKEDYRKLADLKSLATILETDTTKSIVDKYIIDEINIMLN